MCVIQIFVLYSSSSELKYLHMVPSKTILKVGKSEYDILRFNQKFQRDIDAKGRPCSVYYGGEIVVQIESTDNVRLFEQMIDEDMPTVDGSIEVSSGDDERCIRRIDFKEAYIYSYGEEMQVGSWLPMTTTIAISPMRLDYNNLLKIDRRWPDYNGWEKVKEEVKYVKVKSAPNVRITDAYWIDDKNNEVRELVTDNEVTLYVVLEEYTIGQTICLKFEDSDDMGVYRADCSGEVNNDGLLVIEDFKMKKQ